MNCQENRCCPIEIMMGRLTTRIYKARKGETDLSRFGWKKMISANRTPCKNPKEETKSNIFSETISMEFTACTYYAITLSLSLKSVGVRPVNFLNTVLKVVLELNPASNPTDKIV